MSGPILNDGTNVSSRKRADDGLPPEYAAKPKWREVVDRLGLDVPEKATKQDLIDAARAATG